MPHPTLHKTLAQRRLLFFLFFFSFFSFLIIFFPLGVVTAQTCKKTNPCPWRNNGSESLVLHLNFRVSDTQYAPGTRWSEGLAIAERPKTTQNILRTQKTLAKKPKRPPTDPYHEKGKAERNYDALTSYVSNARHKMAICYHIW